MKDNLELLIVKSKYDVEIFWKLFDSYINELSINASFGDGFDLDYFHSNEYRDLIEDLRIRDRNPLRICFFRKEDINIGFIMYVTYFDEGALYIELTPVNKNNERFWTSVGFSKSLDMDEDNKHYYRKTL